MYKAWIIAKREFLALVKTKAFIIGVFLTPFILFGIMFLAAQMEDKGVPDTRINVIDMTGCIYEHLAEQVQTQNKSENTKIILTLDPSSGTSVDEKNLEQFTQQIKDKKFDGLLVISTSVMTDGKGCGYYTMHATNHRPVQLLSQIINNYIVSQRFQQHGIDSILIQKLQQRVAIPLKDLASKNADGSKTRDAMRFIVPFLSCYALFLGILISGQMLVTSTIEEKSSRIIEVILSSASAREIMVGKIIGIGCVGLSLIALYGCAALGAAAKADMLKNIYLTKTIIVMFILYYIVGYFMITSIYAAVGSACNELKEAQAVLSPLTMLLMMPILFAPAIIQHPSSTMAVLLSYIPPFSPFIMNMRLGADPTLSLSAPIISLLIMLPALVVVWWAAAKIFRTGILMYGKPPKLRELLRWLHAS
ncbi:ABC transporter permease [Planctomycetota bacterium]